MKKYLTTLSALIFSVAATAQWNNPHTENPNEKIIHGAFSSSPKTLDPARAYSS